MASDIETAAHQTVAIFAGLLDRPLRLVPGESLTTDGVEIHAPLQGRWAYTEVEHCLAHCVFKSDPQMRQMFVKSYCADVLALAGERGVAIDPKKLGGLIDGLFGLLDDIRVESLWGSIYAGSRDQFHDRNQKYAFVLMQEDDTRLLNYAVHVMSGRRPEDDEPLHAFRPALRNARERIRRRSFRAVPTVLKRLIHELIERILEELKEDPKENQGGGGGGGQPPPSGASSDGTEKLVAMSMLAEASGDVPSYLEDVKTDRLPQPAKSQEIQDTLNDIRDIPPKDEARMQEELDRNGGDAEKLLDELSTKLQNLPPPDENATLTQDNVVFHDVKAADVPDGVKQHAEVLTPEQQDAVGALRSQFQRVRGRRVTSLGEAGYEIDVPTYLQRRIAQQDLPCFVQSASGRGFRCLLLVDCSSSMEGEKALAVQRAHRVLIESLHYPFVTLETWGFNALDHRAAVYRFARGLPFVTGEWAPLTGLTPLHAVLRAATTHMRGSTGVNVVVVLSDGRPYAVTADQLPLGRAQVQRLVRDEVLRAQTAGVRVIGAFVKHRSEDDPVRAEDLREMFGDPRNWRIIQHTEIEAGLVGLISTAFVTYLKGV